MEAKCPCCGGPLDKSLPAKALAHVPMPEMEGRIFRVLASVYPNGLSRDQIASRVYAQSPNGGPLSAESCISVYLVRLRRRIRPYGWMARGRRGLRGSVALQPEEIGQKQKIVKDLLMVHGDAPNP